MRSLILVFAFGACAGLALSACGGSSKCGPSTCDGCCDEDGVCQGGAMVFECGAGGLACRACGTTEYCSAGTCFPTGGSGTGGGPGNGNGPDAGVDAGVDGGGGGSPTRIGFFYAFAHAFDGAAPTSGSNLMAGFWSEASTATTQVIGDCQVTLGGAQSHVGVSAGTLSFSAGSTPISFDQLSDGGYPIWSGEQLFHGGETLTFMAGGGVVPAFTHETVAPGRPTITHPPQASSMTVSRTTPVLIEWTDVSSEYVGISASSGTTYAVCRFPAGQGSAQIPTEVLQYIPAGSGAVSIYGSSGPSQLVVSEWIVNVEGVFTAVWPDGTSASFNATFQ